MQMFSIMTWKMGCGHRWVFPVIGVVLVSIGGCAAEAPEPTSTMTQEQVRDHADKAFDKLKQEEKNRVVGSGAGPY
jgi:hypothetical protein